MNLTRPQDFTHATLLLRGLLCLVLMTAFSGIPSIVRGEAPSEYVIKAAFLYNFAKFVDWPAESFNGSENTLELCVLGDSPFDTALESIKGKVAQGKKLVISSLEALDQTSRCHLVFVSPSEEDRLPQIFPYLQEHHVLSVSDMDDFAQQGGVVGLITIQNKIRFEINLSAARRTGISISSNLLKLARIVDDDPEREN